MNVDEYTAALAERRARIEAECAYNDLARQRLCDRRYTLDIKHRQLSRIERRLGDAVFFSTCLSVEVCDARNLVRDLGGQLEDTSMSVLQHRALGADLAKARATLREICTHPMVLYTDSSPGYGSYDDPTYSDRGCVVCGVTCQDNTVATMENKLLGQSPHRRQKRLYDDCAGCGCRSSCALWELRERLSWYASHSWEEVLESFAGGAVTALAHKLEMPWS